jgi:hypothetical protein
MGFLDVPIPIVTTSRRPTTVRSEAASLVLTDGTWGYAGTHPAGSLTDTSDFVLGASSAYLTTNAAGAYGAIDKTVTWDVSAKMVRVTFKVTGIANITTLKLYLGDSSLTNYFQVSLNPGTGRTTQLIVRDGDWATLDISRGDFTTGAGAPSWASIAKVRFFCQDNATGAVTFRVNAIGLVPDTAVFPNGCVVFALDDADASHWTIAKPYMDRYSFPATCFPILGTLDGTGLQTSQLKTARDYSGWEVGGHASTTAVHSAGLAGLTSAAVKTEFETIKKWMLANGFNSDAYAWPNGDSDGISEAVARTYWACGRGTINQYTQASSVPNPYRITSFNLTSLSSGQATAIVDKVKTGKALGVIVAHKIIASPVGLNDVSTATFQAVVDYCAAQSVPVLTLSEALKQLGRRP